MLFFVDSFKTTCEFETGLKTQVENLNEPFRILRSHGKILFPI